MDKIIVGQIIGNYLQALKKGGVEERLKQIREETFKRMANHPNNSLTYQQILKICAKLEEAEDDDEEDADGYISAFPYTPTKIASFRFPIYWVLQRLDLELIKDYNIGKLRVTQMPGDFTLHSS